MPTLLPLPVTFQVYLTNLGTVRWRQVGPRLPRGVPNLCEWERKSRLRKDAPGAGLGGRGGAVERVSCPPQASGRHSGPAADALGRAAGRRPTLAGNVSPGDAAPGGERGAAAATVRASSVLERTRGATGGWRRRRRETQSGRPARGERRGRRRGSRARTRRSTKNGAAPLRRSCRLRLHVGKRRRSSSLAGIGAPQAEPAGAGP